MEKNIPVREIRKLLSPRRNIDVLRTYYCYQLGSTFARLGLMESTIVMAMATCDKIRLTRLTNDVPAVIYVAERHSHLQESTLGKLITILSKHGIAEPDLAYLKWVKEKRNFFIHRFLITTRGQATLVSHRFECFADGCVTSNTCLREQIHEFTKFCAAGV